MPPTPELLACRAALRGGSRSFFAASRVLPRRVALPATALYAFCRDADDAVDGAAGQPPIGALHDRLDAIYAGRPGPHPADRALAQVVRSHALPRHLLDALLDGFAWDAASRRYATLGELEGYAARVAGSVGAAMAVLMGARSPAALARACDLGVAMQLTNIARDVGEDARAGRLYLPTDWLAEAGVDADAFLRRPAFTPALGLVVRRLLDEADALYRRATPGIALLPLDCRPGIAAARLLYAAIGTEVRRHGYDSVTRRAVVPRTRKLALLARAAGAAAWVGGDPHMPASPATSFLLHAAPVFSLPLSVGEGRGEGRVNAGHAAGWARPSPRPSPQGRGREKAGTPVLDRLDDRVGWVLHLFAQLDGRQEARRS